MRHHLCPSSHDARLSLAVLFGCTGYAAKHPVLLLSLLTPTPTGLADAARSKEWQAAAAEAQAAAEADQQSDRPATDSFKKKKSGLFNSFKEFVAELMPFGLNSTVKGTQRNLQRIMTLQIAAMPEDMPAGEGFDSLEVRDACRHNYQPQPTAYPTTRGWAQRTMLAAGWAGFVLCACRDNGDTGECNACLRA
jgi:hypothetical protein